MGKPKMNTSISLKERGGQFRFTSSGYWHTHFLIAPHTPLSIQPWTMLCTDPKSHFKVFCSISTLLSAMSDAYKKYCQTFWVLSITGSHMNAESDNLNHVHAEQKVIHLGNGKLKKKVTPVLIRSIAVNPTFSYWMK